MWTTISNIVEKVLLNPRKVDRYSPVVLLIKEMFSLSEPPEDKGQPVESLSLLLLYVVAIIPYAITMLVRGFEPLLILQQVVVLLSIGLVLGSLSVTLGFINVLLLGFFNLTGSLITKPDLWLNTASLSGLLIVVLLLLPPHILPNLPARKFVRWWWILAYSFLLGSGIFVIHLLGGHLLKVYFWGALTLGSLAALTPSLTVEKGESQWKIGEGLGWIAGVSYAIGGIAFSWQLYPLLYTPKETAWLDTLVHIAVTIVLLLAHIIAVISMSIIDGEFKNVPTLPTRRWLLFLSFLFFAMITLSVPTSLYGALLATLFFTLSFSAFPWFLNPLTLNKKILSLLITSVTALAMATAITYTGVNPYIDFFVVSLSSDTISSPLVIFIVTTLVFTLSGFHWSTLVTAVAAAGSILLFTGLPMNSPILLVFVGAVIIGFSRILLWPIFSILLIQQSRQIRNASEIEKHTHLPVLNLLESYYFPSPLGRNQVLRSLARRGYPDKFFTSNGLKERYNKIRTETISGDILAVSSIAEMISVDQKLLSPPLLTPIQEVKQIQSDKLSVTERVRRFAQLIQTTQKTIKIGPQTYRTSPITAKEIQTLEHLNHLIYVELRPEVKQYWDIYHLFPQLPEPDKPPVSQQKVSSPTQAVIVSMIRQHYDLPLTNETQQPEQRRVITNTRFYLQQIGALHKRIQVLEPLRARLSQEEESIYNTLIAIQPRLEGFEQELNYQERARLLQNIRQTLPQKPPTTWLTIDPEEDALIEQDNPWTLWINTAEQYLNQLRQLNDDYILWAKNEIVAALSSTETIASLPLLSRKTRHIVSFSEQYGPMLDTTISSLEQISREATSALAFPTGYNRRLGLQETLDHITELRQRLALRFVTEAVPITEPLRQIGELLHSELFVSPDDIINAYQNPYIPGNPLNLQSFELFKGREDLAQKIVNLLRSQSRPTLVLHGPRRMGKTSFLLQLPRLLPSSYLPIYLDMQDAGAQGSDAEFAYALATAIYDQIGRNYRVTEPDYEDFEKRPFTTLTKWLNTVTPLLQDKILLFTIDEFEIIGRALEQGDLSIKVLDYLRHLMQHNNNMILMFAGVQTIEALGPNPASYFISAYPVEISYLHPTEAEELIRNPNPKAGKMPDYDDDVIAHILQQTLCQPLLVQFICSEVINLANEQNLRNIHLDTLHMAIKRVLSATLYFDNIWVDAGQEGQTLLIELANGSKSLAELAFSKETIADLQQRRVIQMLPDGQFAIEIPLVQAWVRRKTTPAV